MQVFRVIYERLLTQGLSTLASGYIVSNLFSFSVFSLLDAGVQGNL
jgi:hypothetical protein